MSLHATETSLPSGKTNRKRKRSAPVLPFSTYARPRLQPGATLVPRNLASENLPDLQRPDREEVCLGPLPSVVLSLTAYIAVYIGLPVVPTVFAGSIEDCRSKVTQR